MSFKKEIVGPLTCGAHINPFFLLPLFLLSFSPFLIGSSPFGRRRAVRAEAALGDDSEQLAGGDEWLDCAGVHGRRQRAAGQLQADSDAGKQAVHSHGCAVSAPIP